MSNSFDLGPKPDKHQAASSGGLLLWIVPAQLAGSWCTARGARFQLEQRFQKVRLRSAPASLGINASWEGRLRGTVLIGGDRGQASRGISGDQLIFNRRWKQRENAADARGQQAAWPWVKLARTVTVRLAGGARAIRRLTEGEPQRGDIESFAPPWL